MATLMPHLVAEWIHFALFGIVLPHYKTKSVHFFGLMSSATKLSLKLKPRTPNPQPPDPTPNQAC